MCGRGCVYTAKVRDPFVYNCRCPWHFYSRSDLPSFISIQHTLESTTHEKYYRFRETIRGRPQMFSQHGIMSRKKNVISAHSQDFWWISEVYPLRILIRRQPHSYGCNTVSFFFFFFSTPVFWKLLYAGQCRANLYANYTGIHDNLYMANVTFDYNMLHSVNLHEKHNSTDMYAVTMQLT